MESLKRFASRLAVTLALLTIPACGDDSSSTAATPDLPAAEWTVFRPGGETICSRGTEYTFLVRGGTVNKVVIDFMGGGACWNELTCSIAGSLFNESIDPDDPDSVYNLEGQGIYDIDNPENPFRDWYHVFIPYCSGDIHWGDSVVTYGAGASAFTIHHKGRVNAQSALDWVYDNFSRPEKIFVTGCSAGSYGSIGWAPHIMQHYSDSQVYQLGDCGAGIITDDFFEMSFPSWNPLGIFPSFIPGVDPERVNPYDYDLAYLYAQIADFFPENVISQYNSNYDDAQVFYYTAMGGAGGPIGWSERMRASIDSAHDQSEHFNSYIAPGERHCIILSDDFYQYTSGGVRLVDWVSNMVNDRPFPSRVACVGDECGTFGQN